MDVKAQCNKASGVVHSASVNVMEVILACASWLYWAGLWAGRVGGR